MLGLLITKAKGQRVTVFTGVCRHDSFPLREEINFFYLKSVPWAFMIRNYFFMPQIADCSHSPHRQAVRTSLMHWLPIISASCSAREARSEQEAQHPNNVRPYSSPSTLRRGTRILLPRERGTGRPRQLCGFVVREFFIHFIAQCYKTVFHAESSLAFRQIMQISICER